MYPLVGCFDMALGFFLVSISVQDIIYSADDGEDTQASYASRTIDAAVDPTNRRQLEIIFGGNVADGAIGIVTKDSLYFDDMYPPGALRKQSFIVYSDITYRVTRSADWTLQAGFTVFLAERHVQQGAII